MLLWHPFPLLQDTPVAPPVPTPAPSRLKPTPVYASGAIMRDYLANATGDDVDFGYLGGAVWAADETAIAQQIQTRLTIFQGEAIYDLALGVPYNTQVFGVNRTQGQILGAFRTQILAVPGVREIVSLSADVQGSLVVIRFAVTTNRGAIAAGQTTVNGG